MEGDLLECLPRATLFVQDLGAGLRSFPRFEDAVNIVQVRRGGGRVRRLLR